MYLIHWSCREEDDEDEEDDDDDDEDEGSRSVSGTRISPDL